MSAIPSNIKITVVPEDPTSIGLDMIIPISVTVPVSGEAEITVGESYAPIARRAAERYGSDITSADAREYILRELMCALGESGYIPSREIIADSTVTYAAYGAEQLRTELVTAVAHAISPRDLGGYDNLTMYEPNEIDRGDGSEWMPICAVTEEGRILSLAAVEEIEQGCAEISVVTADGYTGRGYAASCVCALASFLLSRGLRVKYVTTGSNVPSALVAEKAGLSRESLSYDAVCFAEE